MGLQESECGHQQSATAASGIDDPQGSPRPSLLGNPSERLAHQVFGDIIWCVDDARLASMPTAIPFQHPFVPPPGRVKRLVARLSDLNEYVWRKAVEPITGRRRLAVCISPRQRQAEQVSPKPRIELCAKGSRRAGRVWAACQAGKCIAGNGASFLAIPQEREQRQHLPGCSAAGFVNRARRRLLCEQSPPSLQTFQRSFRNRSTRLARPVRQRSPRATSWGSVIATVSACHDDHLS